MKKVIMLTAVVAACGLMTACGGKTPEEYGEEWCDCMKDAKGDADKAEKCADILDEAKEEFEDDDKAEEKFKEGAKDCER